MHSNQKFGAVISCCSIHFLLTKLREKKHNEENSLPFLRCVSGSIRYIFLLRLSVMLRVSSMIRNPVGRLRRRKSSNLFTSAKKKGMTYGHALLFGARRPECGFPPSAFECLGAAKPLLHKSRPAVGNLRATHRALSLRLLAPNHNRLCWVVILFLVQTYSYCTFFAAAVYVGAKSPLRPRLFISAAKKTTPHDPLFLLSQPQPLTLGCGQGRPGGA